MKITKDALKIMLANKGIKLTLGHTKPNTRIVSFSYPKTLKTTITSKVPSRGRSETINNLLSSIDVFKFKFKETVTLKELGNVEIVKSKKFKHKDYCFNSVVLSTENYKKLKTLSENYGISVSKVIRYLVESL